MDQKKGVTFEMMREILAGLDEGIHVVDSEGMTIFYNKVSSLLDGLELEEVLGMHVLEAFPSLTRKTSTLLNVLETGRAISERNQLYMNRKGKQVLTVNKTVPLKIDNQIVGALEIAKDVTRIKELTDHILDLEEKMRGPRRKKELLKNQYYSFTDIVTSDSKMREEIEKAKKAAVSNSPVLVVGETGTGKELIVQSIHNYSPRRTQPFIAQNCAAIPSALLEGILFGTVKGAFTGAENRPGLFELADGGTLFLDEIHAMPMDLQAKLLRVLEEGVVRRVGSTGLSEVNVRILVATNEDPQVNMAEGKLRKDLFYRINVMRVELPPLRDRVQDISLLADYFLQKICSLFNSSVKQISDEVWGILRGYHWPGNVRELENTLEGALLLTTGKTLQREHLPTHLQNGYSRPGFPHSEPGKSLPHVLSEVEGRMITEALRDSLGNVVQAAKKLGIPRQTLQYKIKKLNLITND